MNKYSVYDSLKIPAMHMPGFRSTLAIQDGVEKKLMFKTWGGIGDQICAEPTLRYAIRQYKNCEIYLASEIPELFSHLNFHSVFNLKSGKPKWDEYLCFETITPPDDSNMVWQFFSHMLTNCVDFPSLCALRMQLPIADRVVKLPAAECGQYALGPNFVVVHAGKHWPSKTFPKDWWDAVLAEIILNDCTPVLIGARSDDNRGTVNVHAYKCMDLRNKLSISETISLLKRSKVLLTNDSSPLHMAVDSNCWIGYIATCKHPDMITHWRSAICENILNPVWGWRMKNHGTGGIWDIVDSCPNKEQEVTAEFVDEETLRSWLPDPKEYARWACEKLK